MATNNSQADVIFALDIGTRTVMGLICQIQNEKLMVLAHHVAVHKDRAMRDGQIHNIPKVAEVVKEVKVALEKKIGRKLTKVAIAAAGRALRTVKGRGYRNFKDIPLLTKEHIQELEVQALLNCKKEIEEKFPQEPLYCVGYSVLNNKINGYNIDFLEGQKGGEAEIEIIATFLPNIVVDSLFEVLKRVDLSIQSLTLEPIAAIEMAIPQKLRMLNLALVDIGAGTSDIAISKGGVVIGYGMVQKAGDKITELLAEKYLIDFATAESLKITLCNKKKASIIDILGIKREISYEEFLEVIKPGVEEITEEIVAEIIALNGKAPSAVFCVGGGSQIETIRQKLAEKLNLPLERVAIRYRENLENVKINSRKLKGPEIITPLGIAAVADKNSFHNFIKVKVNDEEIAIFNPKRVNVAQCLFTAGIKVEEILKGIRQEDFIYFIMGEKVVIPGSKGYPGQIYLNGKQTSLEHEVTEGDSIQVVMPQNPPKVKMSLQDILKPYNYYVNLNGVKKSLIKKIKVNGKNVQPGYILQNNDKIEIEYINSLKELIDHSLDDLDIYVDNKKITEDIEFFNPQKNILNIPQNITFSKISVDENKGEHTQGFSVIANGESIFLDKEKPLVVDVFDKLNFDITQPKGMLRIKKNGLEAGFADRVKPGDSLEFYWE
ncbi:cell division protein FtsA [Anaerobranca gottschalkii]|uniref:Cell division protein FtsA n=1 Tax=Anaerobranca gottschalkii DSM 13577 TaxID=1120990 RepID=A0A1I0C3L1_9FIRM|nr:cell division FtsA domain-containing protein [Anaerobranca gottschalkii]SET14000.1 cell division protein FtsA [Anaerobranca gottschalkii DSM 13577]